MKKKSDASRDLIKFIKFLQTTSGNTVRIVRTDGGKEYDNNFINDFFAANGITHQISNSHTPQQNGVAERMNRTAMESARSSLHMRSNKLTNLFKKGDRSILELWGEFLKSAIYVLNRTLSCNPSSNSSSKTPHELLFGEKPDISHLRVIGCRAYVHVPDANHRKLEPKGIPCWLFGYGDYTKGWRMWDPATRKFIVSRDVTFDENLLISDFNDDSNHHSPKQSEHLLFDPFFLVTEILGLDIDSSAKPGANTTESTVMEPSNDMAPLEQEEPVEMSDVEDDETSEIATENLIDNQATEIRTDPVTVPPTTPQNQPVDTLRRSSRIPKYNARYEEFRKSIGLTALIEDFKSRHSSALFTESFEPQSYKDALNSENADKWLLAFKEEYDSLIENQTWQLVLPPPGCSPINCKWIGKVKPAYDTVPERYKGRLVSIGTKQRFGIDYDEVFSPVPHQEAVKAAFCEIASRDLEVIQFDIKTAFLYATLDKPIFMRQPEGFVSKGKENHVCLLQKSLYGLKQAPRLWYNKLDSVLCKFGLENCAADRCIYIRRTPEEFTIVIAHVDDSFAASNNKTVLQKIGTHLGDNFKVNSVPPTRYIGLNILRDRTTKRIFLSQSHMIGKILQRFGMSNLFPKSFPADPTIHLTANTQPKSEGEKTASPYPFKEAVGALLYLALMTRPDISYAVGQVSR